MATSPAGVGARKHDYLLQDSSASVDLQLALCLEAVYNVTVSLESVCVCVCVRARARACTKFAVDICSLNFIQDVYRHE